MNHWGRMAYHLHSKTGSSTWLPWAEWQNGDDREQTML